MIARFVSIPESPSFSYGEYVNTGIFKVIISEIILLQKNNDDTSKYYFKISSKNKKIDISERIFLDEHLAQNYLNNEHLIEELSKATAL